MAHTNGPWCMSGDLIVTDAPPNGTRPGAVTSIAKMCWNFDGDRNPNGDLPWSEAEANGRLIAAAPDMLKACRLAVNLLDSDGLNSQSSVVQVCRAAIAKAMGETP